MIFKNNALKSETKKGLPMKYKVSKALSSMILQYKDHKINKKILENLVKFEEKDYDVVVCLIKKLKKKEQI